MKILAIYASKNQHGNDATGAFHPQAVGFAKHRRAAGDEVELVPFDPTISDRAARRRAFCDLVRSAKPFDALAYFGHGLRTGLPSAGFRLDSIGELVDAIHARASKRVIVVLYACSAGESPTKAPHGEGGFADVLRDRLAALGHSGWIDAHTVAGHTTTNPLVRRFDLGGGPGEWVVVPQSEGWRTWCALLRENRTVRFGFPFMTIDEARALSIKPYEVPA